MNQTAHHPSPLEPPLPGKAGERLAWGRCRGAVAALAIASAARRWSDLVVVVAADLQEARRLEQGLRFFLAGEDLPILHFPDRETLPYDVFPPLPELISERLLTLHRLGQARRGVLVVPAATLQQRLPPRSFIDAHALVLAPGQRLDLSAFRQRLIAAGYQQVPQVISHGEFAVRGSLFDLFPMGNEVPFRIDLFDDEIDSIRTFDPETQRTTGKVESVQLLPAREFPLDEAGIACFRRNWRSRFEGDPQRSPLYKDVSEGRPVGGLEDYLPLFFDATATLFDYLPEGALMIQSEQVRSEAQAFFEQVEERYEERRHDIERPLLAPDELYLPPDELIARLKRHPGISWRRGALEERPKGFAQAVELANRALPPLAIQARAAEPAGQLKAFLETFQGRVLFVAESAGRREHLAETLAGFEIRPRQVEGWRAFFDGETRLAITAAPIEEGLWLEEPPLAVIPEALLLGERVRQPRRKRAADADQVVRNLAELQPGTPVVHEEHGIGRYLGLQHLDVGGMEQEFLTIEYADGDKLYVPVASLHLISRYTGSSEESAPLHRLGSDQWAKARRKAAEKVRDVAAELLEIHARRAARQGFAFPPPGDDYRQFAAQFEFEETPDQQAAIDAVIADMTAPQPMDRVVCGDVGFGKTEVAMRAAFLATAAGKQVAVLVPTTLLAQQHYDNFADRFADWPVKVASLSRFSNSKATSETLAGLAAGTVDIVVGTHKLLGDQVKFKDLGLVIVDEEHRFGVRHKEKLKALRAEVDLLTLTATPIPRTLNMAMSGMRDLSIIATPPARRHPIKTFVHPWSDALAREAIQRELGRGGQVYVLHNEVSTIGKMADTVRNLVPGARVEIAHGQMRERELERIMRDFYHQRFNVLVCTTIIESGIDVPSANTILINRADKLGLAQLHQLRGRVGRSHHRAYAYLFTPPPRAMTANARKRLEALESLEDLGAGFTLATHDLEIRGAGELLGEEQSGQIQAVGFSLYTRMLEQAVRAIREGRQPELDRPLDHGTEVDLHLPALLPEDYLPDVHARLIQYKRIASAASHEELRDLKVEMIDRFGLLPPQAKNLFDIAELKLEAAPLGITKIDAGPEGGRIHFTAQPAIDPAHLIQLIQTRPQAWRLDGNERLRFFRDLSNPETRVAEVRRVVAELRGN